jgi:hypothetical protein
MDCSHCEYDIETRTEYFELHHHQAGDDAVLQHRFCSDDCLQEYLARQTQKFPSRIVVAKSTAPASDADEPQTRLFEGRGYCAGGSSISASTSSTLFSLRSL